MEGKKVLKSIMVVCLVLHIVIGQSEASSFLTCYLSCMPQCLQKGLTVSTAVCSVGCLAECIHHHEGIKSDSQYTCTLGCARSFCAGLSSPGDLGGDRVEGCVNKCITGCPSL